MAQYVPPPFPHNETGRVFERETTKEKMVRAEHDRQARSLRRPGLWARLFSRKRRR
jgi:hypothetical protein